jgi:pimeloyl-ACP methyl ester carboxylesterase
MRAAGWIGLTTLLGFATGVFAVRSAFRSDMAEITARLEAGSELIATDFGPVEYARKGRGAAALISHGAGGGYDQGLFVGRELLGSEYDIIAPSRFGYLRTPVSGTQPPSAQADAFAALLDRLDVDKAIVLGISAGAPSAIEMALRHPDRVAALILIVPRAYARGREVEAEDTPPNRAVMSMIVRGADFAFWLALKVARRTILRFLGVPVTVDRDADPTERARLTRIMRDILPLSKRVAGIQNDGDTSIEPWPLERIRAPTFVLSAEDDLFGTLPAARFTAGHIAGAEMVVIESGGHLLVGRGAEIRSRIADFLGRRLEAPLKVAA